MNLQGIAWIKNRNKKGYIVEYMSEKMKKFDVVYNSHVESIYKVCLYILGDEEKAEKVTEATFIKFYEHMEEVRPEMVLTHLVIEARNKSYAYKKSMESGMEE